MGSIGLSHVLFFFRHPPRVLLASKINQTHPFAVLPRSTRPLPRRRFTSASDSCRQRTIEPSLSVFDRFRIGHDPPTTTHTPNPIRALLLWRRHDADGSQAAEWVRPCKTGTPIFSCGPSPPSEQRLLFRSCRRHCNHGQQTETAGGIAIMAVQISTLALL
jgi:hypothetical protein